MTTTIPQEAREILDLWYEKGFEEENDLWWEKNPEFDQLLEAKFGPSLDFASKNGGLPSWRVSPRGRLAEIILLDQFSRNIYRNTPRSFAQDGLALALATEAIELGAHKDLTLYERWFMYMPFMHSENIKDQERSMELFEDKEFGVPEAVIWAERHKRIIDKFGHYPHRNEILGRPTTEEERVFLTQPFSSF